MDFFDISNMQGHSPSNIPELPFILIARWGHIHFYFRGSYPPNDPPDAARLAISLISAQTGIVNRVDDSELFGLVQFAAVTRLDAQFLFFYVEFLCPLSNFLPFPAFSPTAPAIPVPFLCDVDQRFAFLLQMLSRIVFVCPTFYQETIVAFIRSELASLESANDVHQKMQTEFPPPCHIGQLLLLASSAVRFSQEGRGLEVHRLFQYVMKNEDPLPDADRDEIPLRVSEMLYRFLKAMRLQSTVPLFFMRRTDAPGEAGFPMVGYVPEDSSSGGGFVIDGILRWMTLKRIEKRLLPRFLMVDILCPAGSLKLSSMDFYLSKKRLGHDDDDGYYELCGVLCQTVVVLRWYDLDHDSDDSAPWIQWSADEEFTSSIARSEPFSHEEMMTDYYSSLDPQLLVYRDRDDSGRRAFLLKDDLGLFEAQRPSCLAAACPAEGAREQRVKSERSLEDRDEILRELMQEEKSNRGRRRQSKKRRRRRGKKARKKRRKPTRNRKQVADSAAIRREEEEARKRERVRQKQEELELEREEQAIREYVLMKTRQAAESRKSSLTPSTSPSRTRKKQQTSVPVEEEMLADAETASSVSVSGAGFVETEVKEESLVSDEFRCVVCLDAVKSVLFQPCNHLVCCQGCAESLEICPMCRTRVEGRVPVFGLRT